MTKFLIIVNPAAGKGRGGRILPKLRSYLKNRALKHKLVLTEEPKHGIHLTKTLSHDFDVIISVGGDGTNNEIINGIQFSSNKILGTLPIGSGNDLGKYLNLHKLSLTDAFDKLFNSQKIIPVDIGYINYSDSDNNETKIHYFINGLGIGFDAYVAYLNQTNKSFSGIVSYIYTVIRALNSFEAIDLEILSDNMSTAVFGKKMLLAIGNGVSAGGGFFLTPNGILNDGSLDLCILDQVSKLKLLVSLPKALLNKIDKVKEISLSRFKKIEIKSKFGTYVHADGENVTTTFFRGEIGLVENNLKIISN